MADSEREFFNRLLAGDDLARLDELGKDQPLDEFPGWSVEENGLLLPGEKQKFTLTSSLVGLDLGFLVSMSDKTNWTQVSWDLNVPGELKPGGGPRDTDRVYGKVLPWAFCELPNMLKMGCGGDDWTTSHYWKYGLIKLAYCEDPEEEKFMLDEKGKARFAAVFVTEPERIETFQVMTGNNLDGRAYQLELTFPQNLGSDRGGFRLSVLSNRVDAWNKVSAKWILETHINRFSLGTDLILRADELVSILNKKTQETKIQLR